MQNNKATVLVVDDDVRITRLLGDILEFEGYQVLTAGDAQSAFELLKKEDPDLVLLDIIMPDVDGYTLCRHIRNSSEVPIIMVTAKDAETEKVAGLEAGADDFVTKPFFTRELAARVRAVLRRTRLWDERPAPPFQSGSLLVDFSKRRVSLDGQEVELTATEQKLLCYLARNAGRVLTADDILTKVWGPEYRGETHLLQVTISRLRQKLGDIADCPRFIATRPGIGYTLICQPA